MAKCDLCGSSEEVLLDHFENHIKKRMNICRRCHGALHTAIYFHAYDTLWVKGFGDPVKRDFYKELHETLVKRGLIKCNECGTLLLH